MKHILFVCRLNLQRSPTAELVYQRLIKSKNLDHKTKSAGVRKGAKRVVDKEIIKWADKIYVMEEWHKEEILKLDSSAENKIKILDIPDIYYKNDPELIKILENKISKDLKT